MRSRAIVFYFVLGGLFGAAAGATALAGVRAEQELIARQSLLLFALAGALMGVPGGIIERSPRKTGIVALAGAMGLIAGGLLIYKTLRMGIAPRAIIAVALGVVCGFGALLAVIHALVDEDRQTMSYPVIMGANGGLAGIVLCFLAARLLGKGQITWILGAGLYSGAVWTGIALAQRLERFERSAQSQTQAPDLAATQMRSDRRT